ncbi:MAG: UvrD-helicase domain-containing protein [Balneolales bacterium]
MLKNKNLDLEEITTQLMQAEGNIIVEAGAGTGKTYNLTNRILHQVSEKGIALDQILAMTFTDYAAAEMRERVYKVISEAIEKETDEKKRQHLISQKREFSRNHILTFHSFCSRVLRFYPDEVADIPIPKLPVSLDNQMYGKQEVCFLDSGFEVLGTYDEILLRQELLTEFYKTYKDHPPLQAQLNILRYSVLEEFLQKLSNKDEDELLKVAQMQPEDYLKHLTKLFESLIRDRKALVDQAWQIIVQHKYWFKNAESLTSFQILEKDSLKRNGAVKKQKIVKGYKREVEEYLDPLLCNICEFTSLIKNLEDYLLDKPEKFLYELKNYRDNDSFDPNHETYHSLIELADISLRWSTFLRYKRVLNNTLNFDDIIWYIRRLFKEKPEIAESLGQRFRYIMIDEFQDTDEKQWEIVKALTSHGQEGKVLIVGDIKQAIYGFRGGDVTMMDRAKQDLQIKNSSLLKTFSLAWSFRSNDTVINFVNDLFDFCFNQETDRKPYMAMPQRLLRPGNRIGEGRNYRGEIRVMEGPDETIMSGDLDPVSKKLIEDDPCWIEALRIADFLHNIRQGRQPGYERITDMMIREQNAVGMLFKRRKNQPLYEQALKLYNLPYTVSSGRGFFNRQEILDCHNLLAFLQDAFDDLSLVGVLRSPFVGLSDAGLLSVRNAMDGHETKHQTTFWQTVVDWEKWGRDAFIPPDRLALSMIAFLKNLRRKTPYTRVSALLEAAVFETNFFNGYIRDPQAEQNVIKLIDVIRQLEGSGRGTVFEIVDFLRIQMEAEVTEADAELPEPGIIQLMTVHGSKGLQFPMVVIPDMCAYNGYGGNQLFETPVDAPLFNLPIFSYNPKDRDGEGGGVSVIHKVINKQCKDRDKAELIRLFYVATTRAESHLLLGHTVGYPKSKKSRNGSFSKLFEGWLNSSKESNLFVSSRLQSDELSELANKAQQGFRLPQNEDRKTKSIDLLKIKEVSEADSLGVKTVTESKVALTKWRVENQWTTIGAADAGTIIHRALDIDPHPGYLNKLLVNQVASLGYPEAEQVEMNNREALLNHIDNARACLKRHFGNALRTMKEVPFEVDIDSNGFIRGTIDMLIQDSDGNWNLIDYKTAITDEKELVAFSSGQGYTSQLLMYQKAFEKLTSMNIPNRRVYLLYSGFSGGRLISLDDLLAGNVS